jgi:hypothetical protein
VQFCTKFDGGVGDLGQACLCMTASVHGKFKEKGVHEMMVWRR